MYHSSCLVRLYYQQAEHAKRSDWRHCDTGTSFHKRVEEWSIDEEEKVANELRGDLWVELTLWKQRPDLVQDVQNTLHLGRDLKLTATRHSATLCIQLQVRTLAEWVALQKVRQDRVQDLIKDQCSH